MVLEFTNVRYIEGAPWEWRRWLTPGTRVTLRLDEKGIQILGPRNDAALRWSEVTVLDPRGPEEPERRNGADPYKSLARGALIGGWLIGAITGALAARRPKEKWCWLACRWPPEARSSSRLADWCAMSCRQSWKNTAIDRPVSAPSCRARSG